MAQNINHTPIILGAIALGGFLWWENKKAAQSGTTVPAVSPDHVPPVTSKQMPAAALPVAAFPLAYGTIGTQVKILQGLLNKWNLAQGYTTIDEDGKWFKETDDNIAQVYGITPVVINESDYDLLMSLAQGDNPLRDFMTAKSGGGPMQFQGDPNGPGGNPFIVY